MSDRTFEISLTALSIIAVLWMILGSIFLFEPTLAIILGFAIWIGAGGTLIYFWGKSYMNKL